MDKLSIDSTVRPETLRIGLRLLDEAVALCMDAGESAFGVRQRVLKSTDYFARQMGRSIHENRPEHPEYVQDHAFFIGYLISIIGKKAPNGKQ